MTEPNEDVSPEPNEFPSLEAILEGIRERLEQVECGDTVSLFHRPQSEVIEELVASIKEEKERMTPEEVTGASWEDDAEAWLDFAESNYLTVPIPQRPLFALGASIANALIFLAKTVESNKS